MSVAPRQWVLHGHHALRGFVIDRALIGEAEAQRRVLATWVPGTEVSVIGPTTWVVLWPKTRPGLAERLPGAAVLERDGAFSACFFDDRGWVALGTIGGGNLVWARAGQITITSPSAREAIDPAEWIDLDAPIEQPAKPLGRPPQAIARPAEASSEPLRAKLLPPSMALADPRAAEVRAAILGPRTAAGPAKERTLRERLAGLVRQMTEAWATSGPTPAPSPSPSRASPTSARASGPGLWSRFKGWLNRTRGTAESRPNVPPPSAVTVRDPPPPPPRSLGSALSRLFARLAEYSRLARRLGEQNARYLESMIDKFEKGDLEEALRYAIPLAGSNDPDPERPTLPAGPPKPRDNLSISIGAKSGTHAIMAGEDLFEHLRRLYRAALARLEREGKFDEAAYVLAELLGQSEEAVAFLERHGRLKLAAELAEGRKLDPALVVRQWLIAGDVERAMLLARRHGVFAAAIRRLETTHPAEARTLRLLWAESAAEAGDFARAVDIVWPLEDARPLAHRWIDLAIEGTDDVAFRMLGKKAFLRPETLPEILPRMLELTEDRDLGRSRIRQAVATDLIASPSSATRVLAKPLLRALLRDRGLGACAWSTKQLTALAEHAKDGALVADLPALRMAPVEDRKARPINVLIDASDAGQIPLFDAAILPKGQLLVACGEGGVRWITRTGRTIAHFDVPAERLVMSDHGDRALALARRGDSMMISKIDLRARGSRLWVDLQLTAFADTFDGGVWYVTEKNALVGLDLLSQRATAIWRVAVDGTPESVARDARSLSLSVARSSVEIVDGAMSIAKDREIWGYELPATTLRHRLPAKSEGLCVVAARQYATIHADGIEHTHGRIATEPDRPHHGIALGPDAELAWLRTADGGINIDVQRRGAPAGLVRLGGTTTARARFQDGSLIVVDHRGRLIIQPMDRHALTADLRL